MNKPTKTKTMKTPPCLPTAAKRILTACLFLSAMCPVQSVQAQEPLAHWTFKAGGPDDATGNYPAVMHGSPGTVPDGDGLELNGINDYLTVENSAGMNFEDATFSIALWIRPDSVEGRQTSAGTRGYTERVLVAKNNYGLGQRQWSLAIDEQGYIGLYLSPGQGWKKALSMTPVQAGEWQHVAVTVEQGFARIYIDGAAETERHLTPTIPPQECRVTLGASMSGSRAVQLFPGAIADVRIYREALDEAAVMKLAKQIQAGGPADNRPPRTARRVETFEIWGGGEIPPVRDLQAAEGVEIHVIKPWEQEVDGYSFLHGVAVAWHKDRLYASFAHNKGAENSPTEEARGRYSEDGGKTWSDPFTIDPGGAGQSGSAPREAPSGEYLTPGADGTVAKSEPASGTGVSHGVFLSRGDELWAFHPRFETHIGNAIMHAYTLGPSTGAWTDRGPVMDEVFFPTSEPVKMDDGNWIMAGFNTKPGWNYAEAAVAISRGDDLMKWDRVVIPRGPAKMWGESAIIVQGARILNVARTQDERWPSLLVAVSEDHGRTWTPSQPSNLPFVTSKPNAGILSNGQRYVIGTTDIDNPKSRVPLTIAVSKPGEEKLSKIFIIKSGMGSYPHATEHNGKLYVGYSASPGRELPPAEGRFAWNRNAAELAIIPIDSLAPDKW